MKLITSKLIKSFNPCISEWEHFNRHYPNYSGTIKHFFNLKNVSMYSKLWVWVRVASKKDIEYVYSGMVLKFYKKHMPDDYHIIKALMATTGDLNPLIIHCSYKADYQLLYHYLKLMRSLRVPEYKHEKLSLCSYIILFDIPLEYIKDTYVL